MFSLNNIVLPNFLESRLPFLSDLGVKFGVFVANIEGNFYTPIWVLSGFVLVLMFKNSIQKISSFQLNYRTVILTSLTLMFGVLSLNKVSEFLYFNF